MKTPGYHGTGPDITIDGVVRSAIDGSPIAGVRVIDIDDPKTEYPVWAEMWGKSPEDPAPWGSAGRPGETETDGRGRFRLEIRKPLWQGEFRKVLLLKEGWFPSARSYGPADFSLAIDVALRPCAVFRARLVDPRGKPVEGGMLCAYPAGMMRALEEETAECSRCRWPEVFEPRSGPDGRVTVWPLAFDMDYVLGVAPIANAGGDQRCVLRIPSGSPDEEARIVVEPGGTVVIRVTGIERRVRELRIRLLGENGAEVATETHKGVDPSHYGSPWSLVECFRNLAAGDYGLELVIDGVPQASPLVPVTIQETKPTYLGVDAATGKWEKRTSL